MPTSISPLTAENMIKANSGAYYLLHQDGGYTGSLNLTGPARIDNLNAGNAYVAGVLNVTGVQANFGNITGFNFNHLARIVNTGDAYLRSVTGVATFNEILATGRTKIDQIYDGLNISGDLGLVGDARMTGAVNITGTLFVNGQQITGLSQVNQDLVLTGDILSLFERKGDILVGTGNSGVSILQTGQNGFLMTVDTGSINGYTFTDPSILGGGGVNYLAQSSGIFGATRTIVVRPTGGINGLSLNFDTLGTGSYIFGPTGFNTVTSTVRNGFLFGSGNTLGGGYRPVAIGEGNNIVGNNSIGMGKGNSIPTASGICFGTNNLSNTAGISIGKDAQSQGVNHFAIGGGGFSNERGSSQTNIYTFKTTTEFSTENLATIPVYGALTHSAITFVCYISAIESGGAGAAGYKIEGTASNGTLIGSAVKTVLGETESSWDANINSSLGISVTSDSAGIVYWSATCIVNQSMSA